MIFSIYWPITTPLSDRQTKDTADEDDDYDYGEKSHATITLSLCVTGEVVCGHNKFEWITNGLPREHLSNCWARIQQARHPSLMYGQQCHSTYWRSTVITFTPLQNLINNCTVRQCTKNDYCTNSIVLAVPHRAIHLVLACQEDLRNVYQNHLLSHATSNGRRCMENMQPYHRT